MAEEPAFAVPPSVGAIIRRAAPRVLRDGVGPLAIFFAGWKLIDLPAGIGMAALFGVCVFVHERRHGRPAMLVRMGLVLVAIRASVGFSSGNATVYLAQEIGIDTLLGLVVLASLTRPRPFASWFADEIVPLPPEVLESDTFRRAMRTVTLAWGIYFLARALVRLAADITLSTNGYALVIALTDAPFVIAMLAWSVYHTFTALRRSDRWGPLMAAAQAAQVPAAQGATVQSESSNSMA